MVLPEIRIKQESEDFEHDSPDFTPPVYKFEVFSKRLKFEDTSEPEYDDWCLPTSRSERGADSPEIKNESVSFEALMDYTEQRCSRCYEKFSESYSLIQHNLKHLEVQLVPIRMYKNQCSTCKECFENRSALMKHVYSVHRKVKTEKLLMAGEEHYAVSKSLHQCKTCGKIQNYKNSHSHMKEVHGMCNIICPVCKATFKCGRYLRRHVYKVHTNKDKPKETIDSPCTQCDAVLANKHALKTHIRNCHAEKVRCELCDSVLKSQSYLNAHMRRVHYDDGKKHICHCGKSFRSPRYLKVHKKNAHSKR